MKRIIATLLVVVLMVGNLPSVMANGGGGGYDYIPEYTEGCFNYIVSYDEATILSVEKSVVGDITVPDTLGGYPVVSINSYAFQNCAGLTSVTIPDSVSYIGYYAFQDCTSLTRVNIPAYAMQIVQGTFYGCTSLKEVTISKSVRNIGSSAFQGCTSLTDITIPDTVTNIDAHAFNGCTSLSSIAIPDKVPSIGDYTFYNCPNLTSVVIGDSVTSIGANAFRACTNLKNITIPASLASVADSAFYGCHNLTDVYYGGTEAKKADITIASYNDSLLNANWSYAGEEPGIGGTCGDNVIWTLDDNGVLTISGTGAMTDTYPWDENIPFGDYKAQIKEVVIEPGITYIGIYLFANCSNLTKVTISEGVTVIGDQAFYNCYNLKDIVLPDGLESIGWETFASCGSLTGIEIPDSVQYIYDSAFRYNNFTSVYIPASLINIGSWAFSGAGSFEVDPNNPNYSNNATGALLNKEQTILMQAPATITGVYTVADSVTVIYDGAFESSYEMTGIVLTDNVTQIEFTAFDGCGKLTDVYYTGTEEQKNAIGISALNDALESATWHYEIAALHINGETQTAYTGIAAAADAATSGTIKLLADAQVGTLVLKPGVTLDLNGHILTADLVVGLQDAVITDGADCIGGGALKVAKGNLALGANNGVVPVWNGQDGYVFTKVTFQQVSDGDIGYVRQIFLPRFSNAAVDALFADGCINNAVQIKMCLTWNNGQCQQFYTYSDDFVSRVYDGTGRLAFILTVTGVDGITDLQIRPEVVADCGAFAIATYG